MSKTPFPVEVIPYTAEVYIAKTTVKSQLIYIAVVLAVTLAIVSLPFIYVDVSVNSAGMLRASVDEQTIIAAVTGKVAKCWLRENQYVCMGDTLLQIDAAAVDVQLKFNTIHIRGLQSRIKDLHMLLDHAKPVKLQSPFFTAAYARYLERLADAENALEKSARDYDRNKGLFYQKVIAPAQFENYKLRYSQAKSKYQLVKKEQQAQWESLAIQYETELKQLLSKQAAVLQEKQRYIIRAPVSGTLLRVGGFRQGSFVSAGQQLAEISPDTSMEAVLFVDPSDIGFLKEGQKASFRIDAFDYNQWGLATGIVSGISRDVYMSADGSRPFFRVTCKLDQHCLMLKNGHKGYFKKGMTLQGRFFITRRSLYQLLYDNVDDWLNPNIRDPRL